MNSISLFLLGCIPVRILIAAFAYHLSPEYLPILGLPLLMLSIGFMYLFFTDNRLNAFEAGGVTWWHHLRLIHGMLYLTASIYAFRKERLVWVPLTIDTLFGLVVFLLHHNFL